MYHEADKVYFKKYGELNSLEGKSNKTGIRFKDKCLIWNRLIIPAIIKKIIYMLMKHFKIKLNIVE